MQFYTTMGKKTYDIVKWITFGILTWLSPKKSNIFKIQSFKINMWVIGKEIVFSQYICDDYVIINTWLLHGVGLANVTSLYYLLKTDILNFLL